MCSGDTFEIYLSRSILIYEMICYIVYIYVCSPSKFTRNILLIVDFAILSTELSIQNQCTECREKLRSWRRVLSHPIGWWRQMVESSKAVVVAVHPMFFFV
jgi:hypothetical protein